MANQQQQRANRLLQFVQAQDAAEPEVQAKSEPVVERCDE
jgi:hypothetical protein